MFACLIASALGGCSFDDRGAGGNGNPGGTGSIGGPIGGRGGYIGTTQDGGQLTEDANCGVAMVNLAMLPPDILVVMDRSGSMLQNATTGMNCPQNDPACVTKWDDMSAGLQEVFTQTQASVNWGLKFFATNGCSVSGAVTVPVAPNNATAINNQINMTNPAGSTPTRAAMNAATTYMTGLTDNNPKFILLATDGLPNCLNNQTNAQGNDPMGAIQAVTAAASAGFPTFVVGIATTGSDADTTLSSMATAGMVPRAGGTPPYYPVSNRAELVSALGAIQRVAASCTMNLGRVPPDPGNVGVRVMGDTRIPRDMTHAQGWDYGAGMRSIILYGSYCDNVMNGTYTDVRALFGCPGLIID